jgi:hypothetical protein
MLRALIWLIRLSCVFAVAYTVCGVPPGRDTNWYELIFGVVFTLGVIQWLSGEVTEWIAQGDGDSANT